MPRRTVAAAGSLITRPEILTKALLKGGTEEQKQQWLPKMVTGEVIGSLGMTEPHAGSDLKAIRTRATLQGNEYVIEIGRAHV